MSARRFQAFRGVYILLFLTIIMAVVCSQIIYLSNKETAIAEEMVIHTYEVIQQSTQLISHLKDMETGQRGFVSTADSAFLESYEEGELFLPETLKQISALVSGNARQIHYLTTSLEPAVNAKLREVRNILSIFAREGRDAALERTSSLIGKELMDSVNHHAEIFINNERNLLASRFQEFSNKKRLENFIQYFSFFLVGVTSTLAILLLRRERKRNFDLLTQLSEANLSLEQKVQERTQQLVEANAAKDHFLGIASHDLKSPLSSIVGLVQLMKRDGGERSPDDLQYLNYMEEASVRMKNLISNILTVNSLDRGAYTVRKENVSIEAVLNKLRLAFAYQAERKRIRLTIPSSPATTFTDKEIVMRILENLLSNALKFSTADTEICVMARDDGDKLTFEIRDQGPGIASDQLPLLFTKFARLDNRPTGGESSNGLGLSIVKELTEMLGGHIKVESAVGKGTAFHVTLPKDAAV